MQFEDPSGKLMMLPSDLVLVQDKEFRAFVKMYAKDQVRIVSCPTHVTHTVSHTSQLANQLVTPRHTHITSCHAHYSDRVMHTFHTISHSSYLAKPS